VNSTTVMARLAISSARIRMDSLNPRQGFSAAVRIAMASG
jgi:hypothetical protein